jgi:hypothetical protein
MRIDCSECEMYRSRHCDDCLVTALLHPPEEPVEIDEELEGCMETLSEAGLVPVLRFRPRAGGGDDNDEVGYGDLGSSLGGCP